MKQITLKDILERFDETFDSWIVKYLIANDAFDMDLRQSVVRTELLQFMNKLFQAQNQQLLEKIKEGIEKEIKDTFKWEEDYKRKGQHELAKVCNIQIGVYEEIKTLIKTLIK